MIVTKAREAITAVQDGERFVLFNGDCQDLLEAAPDGFVDLVLTSPPYFMGKSYDRSYSLDDFRSDHDRLAPVVSRTVSESGSICWQVGYHVRENRLFPLDYAVYNSFSAIEGIELRNRIIWHFEHGIHAPKRFSGRHETILWFTKSDEYHFDLDAVRVPQKYPGKRFYKGPRKGEFSGNPLGKNPADVWAIPNVKANHVEKTDHPCQFPIALCQRLIRALAAPHGLVLDPFSGSASAGIAAVMEGRAFLGAEMSSDFCAIGQERYTQWLAGALRHRPLEKAVWEPGENDAVAKRPQHFAQ